MVTPIFDYLTETHTCHIPIGGEKVSEIVHYEIMNIKMRNDHLTKLQSLHTINTYTNAQCALWGKQLVVFYY